MVSTQEVTQIYQNNAQKMPQVFQVVALYDKAISCLKDAQNYGKNKKFEQKYLEISKAAEIIDGLNRNLNPTKECKHIVKTLRRYYNNMIALISELGGKGASDELYDQACELLHTMRDAWAEIADKESMD